MTSRPACASSTETVHRGTTCMPLAALNGQPPRCLPPAPRWGTFAGLPRRWAGAVRFLVEHIDDRGRQVEASLADSWARVAVAEALSSEPASMTATLDVQNRAGLLQVTGHVTTTTPRSCDRCGEPTSFEVDTDVDLHYAPRGAEPESHPEQGLEEDELDAGWYAGGEIDLADVLREAVALSIPLRIVCADEPACDARVAALIGAPEAKGGHPGLAQLKSLLRT